MGSYTPCNRRHCGHDRSQHRQAQAPGGGVLIGACQHGRCECSQYVHEGLVTGNNVLDLYGDGGFAERQSIYHGDNHISSARRVVVYDI